MKSRTSQNLKSTPLDNVSHGDFLKFEIVNNPVHDHRNFSFQKSRFILSNESNDKIILVSVIKIFGFLHKPTEKKVIVNEITTVVFYNKKNRFCQNLNQDRDKDKKGLCQENHVRQEISVDRICGFVKP